MSDIEELARKLNRQNPVDIQAIIECFDGVFYNQPKGSGPVEAENIGGVCISSEGSVEDLVEKLEMAKRVKPKFIRIGEREYVVDSPKSLSRLIDGIRIGNQG